MIAPILFVDEKTVEGSTQYRYQKLHNNLKDYIHSIEFIGDLDLEYHLNEYTGEVDYTLNPYLETRKIVFIHASLDTPKYPESVINKAKEVHKNTIFVKFSNGRDPNPRIENLIFNRDEHIYNFDKNGFRKFIAFYAQTGRFEFYLFEHGEGAFKQKEDEANLAFDAIKRNIKNDEIFKKRMGDANFLKIMRLADIYQNKERLQKGIEYINSLIHKEEYFAMLERYVKKISEQASTDAEILKNLHL